MLRTLRTGIRATAARLGSFLPRRPERATSGRVLLPWRADAQRSYPTVGLTPARALSLTRAADAGQPEQQYELYSEMLQKWPRLAAVEATRRLALTGLNWEVTPDGRVASRDALEVAAYCQDALAKVEGLDAALDHLASATGYGIAVAELIWEAGQLKEVAPAPYSRLILDVNEPWRIRVRTEDEPVHGIAIDEQPFKWIVHRPRVAPGRPLDGGLLRRSVLLFLAQNFSFKDWLAFSQIAGMPMRVAQFDPGMTDADKRELLRMLESMGTEAAAVFSKAVELQFVEASSSQRPYQPLQDYCNTEVTILWLGQHLTTDLRGSGSRAAAEIHDRVREDLLVDDIATEGRSIRRDVLRPMVLARFGPNALVPRFRRTLSQAVDTRVLADTLSVAVNQLGMTVPQAWAHEALGIPTAGEEPALRRGADS